MAWSIELSTQAEADLAALDRPVAQRIVRFLQERVSSLENPRAIGEPLQGARLGALWRYRGCLREGAKSYAKPRTRFP